MTLQELKNSYHVLKRDNCDYLLFVPTTYGYGFHAAISYNSKKQIVSFNGNDYKNINILNDAIKQWQDSLPFSVRHYDPTLRENVKVSGCINEYLTSIGFKRVDRSWHGNGDIYTMSTMNPYFIEDTIITMQVDVEEDSTNGSVMCTSDKTSGFTRNSFVDLEDAIKTINSMIEPMILCSASGLVEALNKMSDLRQTNDKMGEMVVIDYKTFNTHTFNLRDKVIASLEKTLARLKGEKVEDDDDDDYVLIHKTGLTNMMSTKKYLTNDYSEYNG